MDRQGLHTRRGRQNLALLLLLLTTSPAISAGEEALQLDPALPAYTKMSGISGNLNSIGSDSMNNLMTFWAEGFARFYPNVKLQVEGKGSSTAPPALIAGTAQLGPMSRPMKPSERDQFEARFGFKPLELRASLDVLAVYVHKDNPVVALTLPQVDAIFSKTRRLGLRNPLALWGEVGVTGPLARQPFSLYGRNSASGTYGFFKEHALGSGDFRDEVKEQPGSASVVQGVNEDRAGIGYSGIGYRTSGVRPVPIAVREGATPVAPGVASAHDGTYPLTRFLLLYVNKDPRQPLDPLVREFLRFVFSREGQEAVLKDGYLPLPEAFAAEERKKLE